MGNRRGEAHRRRQQEKEKVTVPLPATIDINADIGEGAGTSRLAEDSALLELISSANIACGYHAGDATSMRETVRASRERTVTIGAHPSYPDIPGFGRRELGLAPTQIRRHVAAQVSALNAICKAEGARLSYVKPHGALYNTIVRDEVQAAAVVEAVRDAGLPLVGLPGAASLRLAQAAGMPVVLEGFADRGYTDEGTLIPRSEPGALLDDPRDAASQAVRLLHDGVDSICVHSDSPGALDMVRAVRVALEYAGAEVRHP